MHIDYNVLKTKLLGLSLIRILRRMYHNTDFKSLDISNINTRAEQLRLNHVLNIFFMIPDLTT